jgi:phosphoglycolate phosphatase
VALAEAMQIPVEEPEVERAREIYARLWRAQVTPRLRALLFPGVLDAIGELRRAGLRLAVVTGKAQEGADHTVDNAGLRPFIEVTLGYTSVKNPKPAPDLALRALELLDVRPADAVVVGDATHDILMARAAGVRSIAVTCGAQPAEALSAAGPDFMVSTFPEAARILLSLTKEP